jgi:uncharacterized membrane protein
MRKFSIRPTLTLKGRTFKGLRGWSGKPFHPPLTDLPIASFLLVAGLDLASVVGGDGRVWARELWHAGTVVVAAGVASSVLAAATGLADASRSSTAGTQARRTINTHAAIMTTTLCAAAGNFIWRLAAYHTESATPPAIAALSVAVAGMVAFGATFGGTLVFDYGFNVETAGKSPVWEPSESDVFPGDHR